MGKSATSVHDNDSAKNATKHSSMHPHSSYSLLSPVRSPLIPASNAISSLAKPLIQPKLKIGAPNDKYEQEADRVADQVMRMSEPSGSKTAGITNNSSSPTIRRLYPGCEDDVQRQPQATHLQINPLANTITSLVQRQEEPEEEEEEIQPGSDQEPEEPTPILDSVPTGDADELGKEDEEEFVQAKPLANTITPMIQRQPEPEEEEEEVQPGSDQEPEEPTPILDSVPTGDADELGKEDEEEFVQAKSHAGTVPQVTPRIAHAINSIKGSGQPLPKSERAFFEPRFGTDFSNVRVHTDNHAVRTAQSINARAFTLGRDVVFGAGQYSPDSHEGRSLLAHELTHVVQQGRGGYGKRRVLPLLSEETVRHEIVGPTLVAPHKFLVDRNLGKVSSNFLYNILLPLKNSFLIQRDIAGTAKIKGKFTVFTPIIKASVGNGGVNNASDVLVVKKLLIDYGYTQIKLTSTMNATTIKSIRKFQRKKCRYRNPDGKITVGKRTWKALTRSYFNPASLKIKQKQFAKKRSIQISPLDISIAVKGTLAHVEDKNKNKLDDANEIAIKSAQKAPGVDNIRARNLRHVAAILQKYYRMGISIENLFINSHGSYWRPAFVIGNETINEKNINRLKILRSLLSPSTKLIVVACHIGGGKNPQRHKAFTGKLAQVLGLTVYVARDVTGSRLYGRVTPASMLPTPKGHRIKGKYFHKKDMKRRPNLYKFLGQWLKAEPGRRKAKIKVINSLIFKTDGSFTIAKKRFPTYSPIERALYQFLITKMYRKKTTK